MALVSCQKEEISVEKSDLEEDLSFQEVPFESLPPIITNFFKTKAYDKGKETTKDFGRFGIVNDSKKIFVAANKKDKSTYTFALKKVKDPRNTERYFDNLVVTYVGEEMKNLTILRYRPESNWLNQKKSKSFDGIMEFYNPNGDKLGSMQLEGGEQIDYKSNQKNYTTTCTYEFESEICSGSGSTEKCLITYNENCTTSYTSPDREYDYGGGESTAGSGSGSTSTKSWVAILS